MDMTNLIKKIKRLDELNDYTKHKKIVNGIITSIEEAEINQGDLLPSVNELSGQLGYSRETVVKAYKSLKERGIINARQGLGYFVANEAIDQKLNLALVLYGFQTFQQTFYNTLRKTLGEDYKIDVYFHHNNIYMYKSILQDIKLKYGMYVVAPIQSDEAAALLDAFPSNKVLIVDRYQYLNEEVSYITQEFERSLEKVFYALKDRMSESEQVVLYYKDGVDYPVGILKSFEKYCKEEQIANEIYKEYDISHLKKNTVYFTVGDGDLWSLLKDAKKAKLKIGTDIGILSHNDSPVKEIIVGGITTFSTDFEEMAKKVADYIMNKQLTKTIIPSKLIRRKSL